MQVRIVSFHLGPDTSEARGGVEELTFPVLLKFAGVVTTNSCSMLRSAFMGDEMDALF
uniref:Uncharacterized protein n=1 Tax=Triticum urartu TaxID=4572 RepID=A0A8R7PNI9_TRIUA